MTNNYNPYQAPQSKMEVYQEPETLVLLDTPNRLPFISGASWIKQSLEIFMERPLLWSLSGLLFWAIIMTIGAIPFLGNIFMIALLAGMGYTAYLIESNQPAEVSDSFIALRENFGKMTRLFFAQLLFLSVSFIPAMIVFFMVMTNWQGGNLDNPNPINLIIAILSLTLFSCLYGAVVWFSHLLVFFHEMPSFSAIKFSIQMSLKNLLPLSLYGAIMGIIWLIGLITFGLAWIVILPITAISTYVAYRQIATEHSFE